MIAVFLLSAQPYLHEMNSSQVLNKATIINDKNEKYVWGDKGLWGWMQKYSRFQKKEIISFESRETLMTSKTIILKFLKRIASLSVISFPQIILFTLYNLKSKYGQEKLLTL